MTPRCQCNCGVNDTAEFFCIREYLREIVTICENTVLQHINKGRRWIIILNYKGGKNFTRDSVPLITISSRKEIQKSCDTVPWIAIYRQTDPVKICTKLLASCLINRQALRSCHLFWNFLLQNSLEQQGTYPSCGKNLATVVIFSSYRQSVATLQLPTILLQYTVYSRKIFGLYGHKSALTTEHLL